MLIVSKCIIYLQLDYFMINKINTTILMKMRKKIMSVLVLCMLFICILSPFSVVGQGGFNPPPDPDDGADFGDDVNDEIPINSLVILSLIAGGVYGIKKIKE